MTVSILDLIFKPKLILTLCLIQVLNVGCSNSDVSVERNKPQIKVLSFDPKNFEGNSPVPELKPGEDALTEWEFGCQTNFDFEIVEESRTSSGKTFVRVRVKKVKMILSAPIQVWLPKDASPDLVAHEKGHQEICIRVYSESDEIARRAAQSAVGRSFEAEGDSREEACKMALAQAQASICAIYHQDASDYASCISEIYDSFDLESQKSSSPDLVQKAFGSYKRVTNKNK